VLDNGSGIIKLGYAGDRVPRVIQQNVSGIPQRFSMHITGMESNLKDYKKYGNEAVAKAGVMHLSKSVMD
jgi:actin-related protein